MVGTPRYLRLVVYRQKVGDEAIHKELGDRMEMAATTASSLEAEQDSVNAVRHMLMLPVQVPAVEVNPIIYTSCIKQFWATAKVQTVNGVRQLQALVDKKRVIITESSIRCDLHLEDAGGTDCLPTATIFEELARMGYEKPTQKLTFYKAFFSPQWKYFILSITQCLSAKSSAWNEFITSEEVGEDSDHPTDSNQIPIVDQPSTSSQPKQKQKSKRRQRKEAEVAHDETEHEESVPTPSNDPLPSAKDAQAKETADLKKRIQRLERKKKSRTTGLRRLKKVGISRRVESSEDQ
ncbi:hypothetical protein Tco_0803477 [Tanacetum coccineum]|uniref:Xylulose kinase-1 n=1 Tax=Tanacetum coccineum TaxID=301880 RepID=A0ABQ5A1R8_9ASTR